MNKILFSFTLLWLVGCGTIDPGADPFVVHAERVTQQCVEAIDAFLKYEADHRPRLDPAVTRFADDIRTNAPPLIRSVRTLTKTYKSTRLPEDKAKLESGISKLESVAQKANGFRENQP